MDDLDDICGAGTSSSLDLSAEEYVDLITDTLATFESVGVVGDIIVPAEEIDDVCQVSCVLMWVRQARE